MAKVYQLEVLGNYTQAKWDQVSHSIIFASSITAISSRTPESGQEGNSIIVTSNIDSSGALMGVDYDLLANDSRPELTIEQSSGKFVDGNLIAVLCSLAEAQADLRNYMTFFATSGEIHLHVGVCNTTQSQDYTPQIIAQSRVRKMISTQQVKNLGL